MLVAGTSVYAQSSISGRIVDKNSRSTLDYATISVLDASDSSFVTASAAGRDAVFKIVNLPAGDYLLEFKFGGYTTTTVKVRISGKDDSRVLGEVALEKRSGDKSTPQIRNR